MHPALFHVCSQVIEDVIYFSIIAHYLVINLDITKFVTIDRMLLTSRIPAVCRTRQK